MHARALEPELLLCPQPKTTTKTKTTSETRTCTMQQLILHTLYHHAPTSLTSRRPTHTAAKCRTAQQWAVLVIRMCSVWFGLVCGGFWWVLVQVDTVLRHGSPCAAVWQDWVALALASPVPRARARAVSARGRFLDLGSWILDLAGCARGRRASAPL
ncbi:hypothetical protein EDC01DRAFT_491141 [Geopyxis carbonaria]|nr:hypothetical protein EDC01DRAFT_491141 [Geopyxis carbonaria]